MFTLMHVPVPDGENDGQWRHPLMADASLPWWMLLFSNRNKKPPVVHLVNAAHFSGSKYHTEIKLESQNLIK